MVEEGFFFFTSIPYLFLRRKLKERREKIEGRTGTKKVKRAKQKKRKK
jgi:hypothetical protein